MRSETRDYDNPTLSIGSPRQDDRYQLEASLDVPMTERVTARIVYSRADNHSNLPSVDFDENLFSVQFNATL